MMGADGRELFWREGMMVAYLLKELDDPYPYAVARIRGQLISRPDFDKVTIPRDIDDHASTLHSPGSANIKF